jgi:hypothetical protein
LILILAVEMIKLEDVPKGFAGIRSRNPLRGCKAFKVRHVQARFSPSYRPSNGNRGREHPVEYRRTMICRCTTRCRTSPGRLRCGERHQPVLLLSIFAAAPKSYSGRMVWFNERDKNITRHRKTCLPPGGTTGSRLQAGGHPAVADNFQNGYNFAGATSPSGGDRGYRHAHRPIGGRPCPGSEIAVAMPRAAWIRHSTT